MLILSHPEFMAQYSQEQGPERLDWRQALQRALAAVSLLSASAPLVIKEPTLPEKYAPRHLKPKQ